MIWQRLSRMRQHQRPKVSVLCLIICCKNKPFTLDFCFRLNSIRNSINIVDDKQYIVTSKHMNIKGILLWHTMMLLKMLCLYLDTLIIDRKSCNMLGLLNEIAPQYCMTNNVFWSKTNIKTQQMTFQNYW